MQHYLIIDQGGQSTRAMIFDDAGRLLASAHEPVATERQLDRRIEHPAPELASSLLLVVDKAVSALERTPTSLVAGLVTQRSSLAAWDHGSGEPLMPVISWQDTRGYEYLPDRKYDNYIRQRTGLFPNAHYGASKMQWCMESLPTLQQARDRKQLRLGPLAAWIARWLTGNEGVDPANGSRTLLMDLNRRNWHPDLLRLFHIEQDWLPPLKPSRSDWGLFRCSGHDIALQLVNGDQSAAFNSYGRLRPGIGYINIGTGAFVAALPGQAQTPARLLESPVFCDMDDCQLVCEGTVNGAASALEAVSAENGADYRGMDSWPEASDMASWNQLPLFINAVGGLGSPWWRADLTSSFKGTGSPREQILAVVESIAFMLATNVNEMQQQGIALERLYLSGGLSNSATLCALIANACGLPAWRSDTSEATARGAAFQLAGFPDHWPEPVLHPVDATWVDKAVIKERFKRWQRLMPRP